MFPPKTVQAVDIAQFPGRSVGFGAVPKNFSGISHCIVRGQQKHTGECFLCKQAVKTLYHSPMQMSIKLFSNSQPINYRCQERYHQGIAHPSGFQKEESDNAQEDAIDQAKPPVAVAAARCRAYIPQPDANVNKTIFQLSTH